MGGGLLGAPDRFPASPEAQKLLGALPLSRSNTGFVMLLPVRELLPLKLHVCDLALISLMIDYESLNDA